MDRSGRECGQSEILRAPPGAVVLLVAAAALAGAPREAAGQCYYTYEQLPNPPGRQCYARSINNQGWVTGYAGNAGDTYRAFIWTPETGTTVLPLPDGYNSQKAFDINELGHVVGFVSGIGGSRAFLWDGQQTTILERPAWASHMEAYGINSSGQIVGMVTNNSFGPTHAFRWQAGQLVDLGPVGNGDYARAHHTNEVNQLFGGAYLDGFERAFVITGDDIRWLPIPEDATASWAESGNNNGFTVGTVILPPAIPGGRPRPRGAIWAPWGLETIPGPTGTTPNVFVKAVNSPGRAVGHYFL